MANAKSEICLALALSIEHLPFSFFRLALSCVAWKQGLFSLQDYLKQSVETPIGQAVVYAPNPSHNAG
jgi:hypothetical protein